MSKQVRNAIAVVFVIFVSYLFYQGSPQAVVVTALGACLLMHLFMSHGSHSANHSGDEDHKSLDKESEKKNKQHGCH